MASLENKLDSILTAIDNLVTRTERIEMKIDNFESRLNEIETGLKSRIDQLEINVKTLSSDEDYRNLEKKINRLEHALQNKSNENLMRESYSKRLNLLIHGLDETKEAWKTKTQTKLTLAKFFQEGLDLDLNSISLVDCHRLPQRPIIKQGQKITRPIIIKLTNAFDKSVICNSASNLKKYNQQFWGSSATNGRSRKSVYITEHLPQQLYHQKKKLLLLFKKAKNQKQATRWATVDGSYCLYIL